MDSKRTTFVILINHRSVPVRKKKLSPTNKARRKATKISLWKKESFGEINSSEDRPKFGPGFVKPIQNGLRKIKNLI